MLIHFEYFLYNDFIIHNKKFKKLLEKVMADNKKKKIYIFIMIGEAKVGKSDIIYHINIINIIKKKIKN